MLKFYFEDEVVEDISHIDSWHDFIHIKSDINARYQYKDEIKQT